MYAKRSAPVLETVQNEITPQWSTKLASRIDVFERYGSWLAYVRDSMTIIRLNARTGPLLQAAVSNTLLGHKVRDDERAIALQVASAIAGLPSPTLFDYHGPINLNDGSTWDYAKPTERIKTIVLMVAQVCNLGCSYCYAGDGSYGSATAHMDSDTIRKTLEDLAGTPAQGHFKVVFFGGEPLLNIPMILETFAITRELRARTGNTFEFRMTTNATQVSDRVASLLAEEKVDVAVSLDAPALLHDRRRPLKGGQGSWEKAVAGATRLLKALGPDRVRANAVLGDPVDDMDIEEIQEKGIMLAAWDTLRDLGFTRINLIRTVAANQVDPDRLKRYAEDHHRFVQEIGKRARTQPQEREAALRSFRQLSALKKRAGAHVGCSAGMGSISVTTTGKYTPCYTFAEDRRFDVGDVASGINPQRLAAWQKAVMGKTTLDAPLQVGVNTGMFPECRTCMASPVCAGGCYYQHQELNQRVNEPHPDWCESIRDRYKDMIYLMSTLMEKGEG
jgi:uncharacterized protein